MNYCENCSEPLDDSLNPGTDYQFKDALWLGFFGGFGMYLESPQMMPVNSRNLLESTGATASAVICMSCAEKLFEALPGLAAKLY